MDKPAYASLDETWNNIDGPIKRRVTAVVIGAGQRGSNYAYFAKDFPSRMKVVAVAEPIKHRRDKCQKMHNIPDNLVVDDWRDLILLERLADFAIIATQDQMHKAPAIAFVNKGYHLLLEKPMAVSEKDCDEIAKACIKNNAIVAVCHVLRYLPPCMKIRELIDSGILGEIVSLDHRENILYWHFAHSFVRGNWRNTKESTFSLLAKSCHDIDLIQYWMGDMKCTKIHSFGGLFHFKKDKQPAGAASRCLDCLVEYSCPYSANKIYLQRSNSVPHWPMSAVCDIEDHPKGYLAALRESLETGPYGRCVFECDNDVVDHQTVTMEFVSGATANFTMNAFTPDMRRETRICGTHGELRWDGSSSNPLQLQIFATNEVQEIDPGFVLPTGCKLSGHGGADFFIMNSLTKAIAAGDKDIVTSDIRDSLRSHKLVFAAEKSRLEGAVIRADF